MRYIVNKNNKVMATIESGNVSLEDLQSREERIVEGPAIHLSCAHLENGKIVEKKLVILKTDEEKDRALIYHRMFENVKDELKSEGKLSYYK